MLRALQEPATRGSPIRLMFDAAKPGIHKRVVRLEPVAERPAQHAGGGSRRGTLHDVVLIVKEIGRIAGIKREWRKARKWREERARPLPSVAEKASRAKG